MSDQIKPSVTNPTIAELYGKIQDGSLVLAPDFQRRFVWTHDHQEEFLDTILRGFPFPEIYVCIGEIDVGKMKTTKLVIDGQQRLTTIKKYIDGDHEKPLSKVPYFKDLGEKAKSFISYEVVVRDLGKVDDATIREVFRRINLTKFQLESVEIHNAIYDGKFIVTAKKIVELTDLRKYEVFHESELTRMADLYFILLLMSTIQLGGYFHEDREIERCIAKYNDEYPDAKSITDLICNTFKAIDDMNIQKDSIWLRKSNFFTLAFEVATHISNIPEDFLEKILELEKNIMQNRGDYDNIYGRYYRYMYQGTNQRKARVVRSEIFRHFVFGAPLPTT